MHALQEIEAAYNDKPYHNSMHAADVTQSVGALLATDGFSDQLTDLELLAVILASVVHDVGHPGERWRTSLEGWPHRCSSVPDPVATITFTLACRQCSDLSSCRLCVGIS